MPRFEVTSHLTFNGQEYEIGSTVEMSADTAAPIPWAVKPMAAPSKPDSSKADKPAKQ